MMNLGVSRHTARLMSLLKIVRNLIKRTALKIDMSYNYTLKIIVLTSMTIPLSLFTTFRLPNRKSIFL